MEMSHLGMGWKGVEVVASEHESTGRAANGAPTCGNGPGIPPVEREDRPKAQSGRGWIVGLDLV